MNIREKKSSLKNLPLLIAPALIGVIFIIIASLNLGGSIWFDESYSAMLNRFSPGEIIQLTARDVHPPLYYLTLKLWGGIFGETDVALRFMSVFFGALSLLAAYVLVKRWFGRKPAVISAAFMALSPTLLRYSQEMRMYTLSVFLVVFATLVFSIAIDHTFINRQKSSASKIFGFTVSSWLLWLLYGFIVALGMLTHYFTAGAWLAHVAYLAYRFRLKLFHPQVVSAYFFSLLVFLPWLPSLLSQTRSVQGGFWIPAVNGTTLSDYISDAILLQPIWGLKDWLAVGFIIALFLLLYLIISGWKISSASFKKSANLIVLLAVIPPLFLLFASMPPLKPVFINRYITYASTLLWLLLGLSVSSIVAQLHRMKPGKKRISIGIIAATFSAALILNINISLCRTPSGYAKPAMTDIASQSRERSNSATPVLAADELTFYQFVFYEREQHPVYTIRNWRSVSWVPPDPLDRLRTNIFESLEEFTAKYQTFWLAQKPDDPADSQLNLIKKTHSPLTTINTGHYILTEFIKK